MSDENIEETEETPDSGTEDGSPWDKMADLIKKTVSSELDAREEKWEQQRVNSTSRSAKLDSKTPSKGQTLGKFHEAFFGTRKPPED